MERSLLPKGVKKRQHWLLDDPAKATGNEDQIMAKFRTVRDEIKLHTAALLAELNPKNDSHDNLG